MAPTEKQKMIAGELYDAGDAELQADLKRAHQWMAERGRRQYGVPSLRVNSHFPSGSSTAFRSSAG